MSLKIVPPLGGVVGVGAQAHRPSYPFQPFQTWLDPPNLHLAPWPRVQSESKMTFSKNDATPLGRLKRAFLNHLHPVWTLGTSNRAPMGTATSLETGPNQIKNRSPDDTFPKTDSGSLGMLKHAFETHLHLLIALSLRMHIWGANIGGCPKRTSQSG